MPSQWYKLKDAAISLRKQGLSLRDVEAKLGIPRPTLSYWFRDVTLTARQRARLFKNWKNALGKARIEAVKWHNAQKAARLEKARQEALSTLRRLPTKNKDVIDLALAMLYLGEGSKTTPGTSIGSSSSLILKFFIKALQEVYNLDCTKIRCELHLRSDQKAKYEKKYWSKELGVPITYFTSVAVDQRTKGSVTYKHYHGVCVLRCSNAAIQRKLMYLAEVYSQKIISE